MKRWNKANRSRGDCLHPGCERIDAFAKESRRCENEVLSNARAATTSSAQVQRVQYLSKFADDVKRLEEEMNP